MRATAASTGTDGWHTAIDMAIAAEAMKHADDVVDVIVEIETALRDSGTMRASTQSVM